MYVNTKSITFVLPFEAITPIVVTLGTVLLKGTALGRVPGQAERAI